MLNPALDSTALANAFSEDGRVRIDNLLLTESEAEVLSLCTSQLQFDYLFFANGKNQVFSTAQIATLDPKARAKMQQALFDQAAEGVGFFYCGRRMRDESTSEQLGANTEPALLKALFKLFNSDELLSLISKITGDTSLKDADGQYTRYSQGQFLTRHSDAIQAERRRFAYVLGLSPRWHPDWGGLLQFYEKDGTPRDAWQPRFNSLSLFDVSHIHSVTYVTPFAKNPRYSFTGWFRN
jgi:SM-20-related protein